ncbi:unnamed protein product [Sphenostylis stenocarpa]|uniref:Uncharacterized protein n=1 Tax=Sphenostylis stenocarpa TaxID=92480 RepID=A0AA86VLK0_9FABA|nr:unnamed protein product [Sphenostylis stenocarpa]
MNWRLDSAAATNIVTVLNKYIETYGDVLLDMDPQKTPTVIHMMNSSSSVGSTIHDADMLCLDWRSHV